MSSKEQIVQKTKKQAFEALDHALNRFFEYTHLDDDAAWEIAEHLKNNNCLKDTQHTLATAIELATPNHEMKRLRLGSALYHANDDVVSDLLQFLNRVETVCEFATETANPKSNVKWIAEHLKGDRRKMLREVEGELMQRVELYRQDIDQLKENQEATQ